MPKDGFYFDFLVTTMAGARIDPDAFQPCDTVSDEELDMFAEQARFFYENTDKALLGWGASISMMGLSSLLSDNITQGALEVVPPHLYWTETPLRRLEWILVGTTLADARLVFIDRPAKLLVL